MVEQSREGKEGRRRRVLLFIEGKGRPASTAPERGRHGVRNVSPCEEAAKTVSSKQLRGAGGKQEVASGFKLIFLNYLQNCHCVYFANYSQFF